MTWNVAGIATAALGIAGAGVIAAGIIHNHCPSFLGIPGDCSSLGWVDQQVGRSFGQYYFNTGELMLMAIGGTLVFVGRSYPIAVLLGAIYILLGLTGFVFAFPFG